MRGDCSDGGIKDNEGSADCRSLLTERDRGMKKRRQKKGLWKGEV